MREMTIDDLTLVNNNGILIPIANDDDNIEMWVNKCDSICRLRFNTNRKIDDELNRVGDFLPAWKTYAEGKMHGVIR